jgi:hypothetical protein
MEKRFSKEHVRNIIGARIEALEKKYLFKMNDGYNQVKEGGEALNRAYGEYSALIDLYSELFD